MPRRSITFIRGHYYHIYNRGAHRMPIFREERNYRYLLGLIKQVAAASELTVVAYCLLPNHYHWLVRQDGDTPVRVLPWRVFTSYGQAYNRAYRHSGTLFEGGYHAKHVATDDYLRHLCRYIHANPVRHGLVSTPEAWLYSNYLEWVGQRGGSLVDLEFVRDYFGSAEHYAAFVREYLEGRAALSQEQRRLQSGWETAG